MLRFIIDENLPYRFKLWNNEGFVHVNDVEGIKSDPDIWQYAKENNLIIVTKDADFSLKIMYRVSLKIWEFEYETISLFAQQDLA